MSDIFASATVKITPSLTGFKADLEKDLKEIMAKVKVRPIKIAPALTANFVGDLRGKVNAGIAQAQRGVKPIIIRTVIEAPSRRQLTNLAQAPLTVGAVGGGSSPVAAVGRGADVANEKLVNSLLSRHAVLLGDVVDGEKEVTKAIRVRGAAQVKTETRAQQAARAEKISAQSAKKGLEAPFVAAAKGGTELAKARTELKEQTDRLALAEKARSISLTKTTKDEHEAAKASRQLAFERVNALEASQTAAGGSGAASTSAERSLQRNREKTFSEARQAARGLRDADVASAKLGKSTKDLAGAQSILTTRQIAGRDATKALTAAELTGSDKRRAFTQNLVNTSKSAIKSSEDQIAAIRKLNKESAKSARSSEQLTRGGQASILSLAGIRGATLAASRSFLVGAAAITVFAKAVKSFADLEENINIFQATTSATADQMERVRDAARALGADLTLPAVSAGDAAGAMVELAKAGLTVEDAIAGARGVLELATAAAIDNAAATQLVANALNAFGLQGRDAITIADTFANAANAAQGSIADIGTAFQQAAAAGRQVGLSFQDTATFLTVLAKNGLRGSDAGTSLRTALIRLINPSKEAAAQFEKLGIVVHDAAGNLRPDVFLQIADATNRLAPAQRDATIALIGGQDAFRAITILGRQTVGQFIALRKALREEGTAAALAEARTRGLHGAVDALGSVLETVGTDLGGKVGPGLARFTRGVASSITAMSESDQIADTLSNTLTAVSQGFQVAGVAAKTAFEGLPVGIPVLDNGLKDLANRMLQLANAIGIGNILAGIAAYKILGGVFARLTPIIRGTTGAYIGLGVAQNASLVSTKGLATALTSLITPQRILLLTLAGIAAGTAFYVTELNGAEAATNALASSSDRLASALAAVKSTQSAAVLAGTSVDSAQLAVLDAKARAGAAETAFASSNAARGSVERKRLELGLAIALDDVVAAEQRYKDVVREANVADKAAKVARLEHKDAIRDQIDDLDELLRVQLNERNLDRQGNVRGTRSQNIEAQGKALRAYIKTLRDRAKADRETGTVESIQNSKRETQLANLIELTKKVPPRVLLSVIVNDSQAQKALSTIARAAGGKEVSEAALNAAKKVLQGLADNLRARGNETAAAFLEGLIAGAKPVAPFMIPHIFEGMAGQVRDRGFELGGGLIDAMAAGAAANASKLASALAAATTAGSRAQRREDLLAGAGASDSVLIGAAQDRLAAARRRVIAAQAQVAAHPGNDEFQTAFDEAASERRAAFEHLRDLQGQVTSDAKAAGEKIATDSANATQAFLDSFEARRNELQNKITSAGFTPALRDDIATNKALLKFFKRRIELIKQRIKNMKLYGDALKAARAAIAGFVQDIFNTNNTIDELTAQLTARINERLDLRIQLAEARDNLPAQIRAHRAKLKEITKELVRAKQQYGINSLAWLRLKVAQQEEIKRINELKESTKEKVNATAAMQFTFLQTQAGFAANLLGNLIPLGATGGLLGGTTGTGGGPSPLRQVAGGFEQPRGAQGLPKPGTAGPGGPSRGGQMSQTHLLREILRVLNNIYRGTGHPEAHHRRRTNASAMALDHLGT